MIQQRLKSWLAELGCWELHRTQSTNGKDHLQGISANHRGSPLDVAKPGRITESIAAYSGLKAQNFEEAKLYEGQSVFAEVVAASGIPGSLPFLCFLIVTIISPLQLASRSSPLHAAVAAVSRDGVGF